MYEIWNPELTEDGRLRTPRFFRDWAWGMKHVMVGVKECAVLTVILIVVMGIDCFLDAKGPWLGLIELAIIQFIALRIIRSTWNNILGTTDGTTVEIGTEDDAYAIIKRAISATSSRALLVEVPVEVELEVLKKASKDEQDQMTREFIKKMGDVSGTTDDGQGIVTCIARPVFETAGVKVDMRTMQAIKEDSSGSASTDRFIDAEIAVKRFCHSTAGSEFRLRVVDELTAIAQEEFLETNKLAGQSLRMPELPARQKANTSPFRNIVVEPGCEVSMFKTSFVYGFFGGLLTLLLVVPGVWFFVRSSLAVIFTALEKSTPVASLEASGQLVAGHYWRAFRYVFLGPLLLGSILFILAMIVAVILPFVLGPYAEMVTEVMFTIVFGVGFSFLQFSIYPLLTYLYAYLKESKSGLSRELSIATRLS